MELLLLNHGLCPGGEQQKGLPCISPVFGKKGKETPPTKTKSKSIRREKKRRKEGNHFLSFWRGRGGKKKRRGGGGDAHVMYFLQLSNSFVCLGGGGEKGRGENAEVLFVTVGGEGEGEEHL